jgi:NADPH:quinone reductase-like Zn-dependent oxidoreductase
VPRAVRFDRYGDVDVLTVVDVERPVPGSGQALVRVKAAGINPGEAAIRRGALHDVFPATFPSGQGSDLAGVVVEAGEGVGEFSAGDEVLGWSERRSSHAEYVVVPATRLVPKPPPLGWEVAGALYVAGCTAWAAVRAVGARAGETVAVSGAAGGVGTLVVQLLRLHGVSVLGIASSPASTAWLTAHGVTPVPYGEGLADRLRREAPGGVDGFVDLFGPAYLRLAVDLGVRPERIETIISFREAHEIGAKAEGSATASTREVLAQVTDLVVAGRIEVPVAAVFPLAQVRDAYARLERRHTLGKIVLVP